MNDNENLPYPLEYEHLQEMFVDDEFTSSMLSAVYNYAGDTPTAYMILSTDKHLAYKMAKIEKYRHAVCSQREDGTIRVRVLA